MKKFIILFCTLLFVLPASAQTYKALFDNTKNETAGNADWIIDTDQPIPAPAQSTITSGTAENYWLGAISAWGISLAKRGWSVATLTTTYGITYGNASNAYDLSKYDLFIVCEPQSQFTATEKTAIKNFVQNGGGLMMVADHDGSDRNSDGWDGPKVWNDLRADSLFGIHFQSTGETNNNISQVATNVKSGDVLITGTGLSSAVSNISYHNGTTMTMLPSVNPNATGHIWMNGAAQGNSQIMFATSKYGSGRVAGVGDSSPADDGSAQSGNSSIYNGWGETGATDSTVFMNACLWLVQHDVTVTKFNITATAGSNGSITPSGTVSVDSATSQSFAIAANSGYHIDSVIVDGVNQGAVSTYNFTNVAAAHTIRAVFAVTQYQISASSGLNGSISPTGSVFVNSGSNQLFTFTPSTGYHVDSLVIDGVKQGSSPSTYTFSNVVATHTIRVSFAINTYTITASANGSGTISPVGAVTVSYGQNQTFTITAGPSASITNVVVDGSSVGAVGTYTFTGVTANHTIAATFSGSSYTITASAGSGGSISPSGAINVLSGQNQSFTITPSSGYSISGVLVDGSSVGAVGSYSFTNVTANHTIAASFTPIVYTISASAGTGGSISPSGSVNVNSGQNQSFTITPSTGYAISGVLVDGSSVGAVGTYAFTNVTANHTIAATFMALTYTVNASAGAGGSISPSGSVVVSYGLNQAFTISANSGYGVADVLVDGNSVGPVTTYTFSNVTASHTIAASFAVSAFTISASAGTGGTITPYGSIGVTSGSNSPFTVTADSGYYIESLLVDGNPIGAASGLLSYVYTFTSISADHSIQATFTAYQYTLAVSGAGGTVAQIPNQETYTFGAFVQLTPSASPGYEFLRWSGDVGAGHVSDNPLTVRVDSNMNITAVFGQQAFPLNITAIHGTVTRSPNQAGYDSGAVVQLSAVPDSGYTFTGWTGDVTTNSNPLTVFMLGPKNLVAHFLGDSATLTPIAGEHGHVSPASAITIATLRSQRFTFTPDPGYITDSVIVDGIPAMDSTKGYTFISVTDDHSVRVTFASTTFALRVRQSRGWNIVSLPLDVADAHVSVLFPTGGPNAFEFSGGYVQRNTLRPGVGYWMKSTAAIDSSLDGTPVIAESIQVVTGWNMIGSIAPPLAVNLIASDPPGLLTGQFFGYSNGYAPVDTIVPAKGYWVKSSGSGTLLLSYYASFESSNNHLRIVASAERPPAPPVADEVSNIPSTYALGQNYPNPFNPSTTIRFALPQDGTVSLKVYDIFGREVTNLSAGKLSAGEHNVVWNASGVSSGTYFYRLSAGSFTQTKMMVLLK